MQEVQKGTFIVIDGADGSGKATQTKLLVEKLKSDGHNVHTIDFPRYDSNFFGKFIGEALVGDYGYFVDVDPHIASVLYAADRFESKERVEGWLAEGAVVIADRYASSNQIHQGGKLKDEVSRRTFLEWLDTMEFDVFKIPRPDHIVYLDVPTRVSQELVQEKTALDKKVYLKEGQKDMTEDSVLYQDNSRESAMKIISERNTWTRIDCMDGESLRSIDTIHEDVLDVVTKLLS